MRLVRGLRRLLPLLLVMPAWAHVGTSNVFVEGQAGPYTVYVTVTPPVVVPGEAQVSVICADPGVRSVTAQANVLLAQGAGQMPEGQALEPGPAGSHEFHGTQWLMASGSWQVRVTVEGARGTGSLAVPVTASPSRVLSMSKPLGALLLMLGLLLIAAVAAIAAAAVREAQQPPGSEPLPRDRRRGRRAGMLAVVCVAVLLAGFGKLWSEQAARYRTKLYRPLALGTAVEGDTLKVTLKQPSGVEEMLSTRRLDDLVLDHNHLMHLYALRWPTMDVVYHLHPAQISAGSFALDLPAIPAGDYRLFADVVHADGFPETASGMLHLDHPQGRALAGDDARGALPPLEHAQETRDFVLADGYRYRFSAVTPAGAPVERLQANQPVELRFTLLDPAGNAPGDMRDYMGMLGHVAVVRQDGGVFAHIHPNGSAAMAAYMLANAGPMAGMDSTAAAGLPSTAAFPFGFPSAGRYRVVVQMKHGDTVETGAVDVEVH